MTAKDIFHDAVSQGLKKEGWTITNDPLSLKFGDTRIYIDLGAEKILTADKGEEKIAVEIKTFIGDSVLFNFHVAIGQFINYQIALENKEPNRILYLAIPQEIYNTFFQSLLAQSVIQKYQIPLIIYEPESEVILQWLI
ncbi:element excision factor XisH family protein [Geminocystis herdmanii]|uniref:element excision factor XisH family protein n=1 Tax=Geminocystis herdmanii TaxID=669359 RepID=UPI00034A5D87|nr:element excision factor XisH family protein [Geminocystis herdmanii]